MAKKKTDKRDLQTVLETCNNPMAYRDEFETICGIIASYKKRAMRAVHNESLLMIWKVGAFVSDRLKRAVWGGWSSPYAGGLYPHPESQSQRLEL